MPLPARLLESSPRKPVYTRLSSYVGRSLKHPFRPRDKHISHEQVTEGLFRGLGNANTGRYANAPRPISVFPDPQVAVSRRQIAPIVANPGDRESLGQPSWSAGKSNQVFGAVDLDPAGLSHFLHA